MITRAELEQAISDCTEEPITGTKRSILADLIIIQDYLFGDAQSKDIRWRSGPSYGDAMSSIITTDCGSTFLRSADGKNAEKVLHLVDELLDGVKVLHPRMYDVFIQKLDNI